MRGSRARHPRPLPSIPRTLGSASPPILGPEVPRTGGRFSRAVGRLTLRLLGFRVEGTMPNLPRFVVIVAPHTSNWDFPVGLAVKMALALDVTWFGKNTLFWFPLSIFLRAVGGIPVNRSASNDVVQQLTAEFTKRDRLVLALTPEGTRKRVDRWRTGFYHIAHAAGVPVVPVAFDWRVRAVRLLPPFFTTGDVDLDISQLRQLFAGLEGRRK